MRIERSVIDTVWIQHVNQLAATGKGPLTPAIYRRELLHELLNPRSRKKWVNNPLLNFSVLTKVDQIAGVNLST